MSIKYIFHDYNYYEIKYIFEEDNKKSFDYEYIDIDNDISFINKINLMQLFSMKYLSLKLFIKIKKINNKSHDI